MANFTLQLGDCLETLKTLPDGSVDSVITDPPYGLSQHTPQQVADCLGAWLRGEEYKPKGKGFMGKSWDAWVPSPAVWRECLRVLKPGGHLLAFAGTRSMDLMSMAVRLAGFELRDSIGYAHDGGGAPLLAWAYGSGFPKSLDVSKAIDKRGGATKMLQETLGNFMLSHYLTDGSQPAIPNYRDYKIIRDTVGLGPEFDHLFREEAEREVIGQGYRVRNESTVQIAGVSEGVYDLTAPATESAKQWQGWGTALKPAWEPIILARKPLEGAVAENVLKHGTGALNIDASRIMTEGQERDAETPQSARWPANLIHDGSKELTGLLGSAARFFYCAKASKKDRDELNIHPTVKPTDLMRYLCRLVTPPNGTVLDPFTGSGSTGKAAILEGFNFIGCEMQPNYHAIAKARIEAACTT